LQEGAHNYEEKIFNGGGLNDVFDFDINCYTPFGCCQLQGATGGYAV
jgi:hypothetical protein